MMRRLAIWRAPLLQVFHSTDLALHASQVILRHGARLLLAIPRCQQFTAIEKLGHNLWDHWKTMDLGNDIER